MDCLVLPVALMRRCYTGGSRLGYRPLADDGFDESGQLVTVVVGKEKREFLVDSLVLEANPFRALIEMMKKDDRKETLGADRSKKRVILVDVDAILFEHMLWLMHNDCSSLFKLNLKEIIDFYAQDY